jgi:NAD(P)-dependent dehydrogenase (short-subunit alcohol dehydrogenase family)
VRDGDFHRRFLRANLMSGLVTVGRPVAASRRTTALNCVANAPAAEAASKAATMSFTRSLARESAPKGSFGGC